ncbi:hypothetical protein ACOKM5_23300 [Streptomyces sp. BH097]|uniref:hypothetical protein n=1 Tax=unclassified Streptomyces TaxID=2593676 RepID=UPI003BB6312F
MTTLLEASRRALASLTDLIRDSRDPGTEAITAQYELQQALVVASVAAPPVTAPADPAAEDPDATAYRHFRDAILATMTDPDAWDGDDDEETILARYVQTLSQQATQSAEQPADTGLRDRIAEALANHVGWKWTPGFRAQSPAWHDFQKEAEAVLTVLPAPADRAAVLREAADIAARWNSGCQDCATELELRNHYRRMADEAQQADGTEDAEATARRFARRLHAVERLCSGRPGYHTVTVKTLLTAMSEADEEQQP